MKGKYKMFSLIPAITICRDTQALKDLGYSSWEFYFEWLWFQLEFHIESEQEVKQNRCCGRCDGIDDICVADMKCEEHDTYGCEICYGPRMI